MNHPDVVVEAKSDKAHAEPFPLPRERKQSKEHESRDKMRGEGDQQSPKGQVLGEDINRKQAKEDRKGDCETPRCPIKKVTSQVVHENQKL